MFNPFLANEYKMVKHTITILQQMLQHLYCVCNHFVFNGKKRLDVLATIHYSFYDFKSKYT